MKHTWLLSLWLLSLAFLTGCTYSISKKPTTPPDTTLINSGYTTDSWKTTIPETCQSFYDGCNHCSRVGTWTDIACTEMYCEIYSESYCKDNLPIDESNQNLDVQTLNSIYVWVSVDEAITEASKRSTSFRVVEIDGEPQAVRMDYRPWRINATTVSGFVTSISIE